VASEIKISSKGVPQVERALVVDPVQANARLIADILRNSGPTQVQYAANDQRGLLLARDSDPQIIFIELSAAGVDGLDFTRRLRRSDFTCREVPVVMVTGAATAAGIMAARDAGVHEFLRRPFTMGDLQKRVDAVALRKRDWIEAVAYVGPDRRRFNSADYTGPRKRGSDKAAPEMQRINQALKIVRSAIGAVETDPKQVFRALKAQADTLAAISLSNPDLKALGAATAGMHRYLAEALKAGRLTREMVELHGQAMIAAGPSDDQAQKNAQAA
jgi:CheY-like chemotaxis protein